MTILESTTKAVPENARAEATLNDRARQLAEVPPLLDQGRAMDALVCRVGVEEYALELRLLHGVFPATVLTVVPCAPPFVAGLLNLRGEILTVLDLAAALGLIGPEKREVLVAETERVRVGLLLGEVLGVQRIDLATLDRGLAGRDFTRGIAQAKIVLLDLEALLADRRFTPSDEGRTAATPSAERER